jgi:acyl-CoA thioesterase-1
MPLTVIRFASCLSASVGYGTVARFCKALPIVAMTVLPAGAEPVTVVALGDSLTAGYGLPEGEGLVPHLIVTLGGNDLLRGLDPATTRANLDAILAKAQARNLPVLLIGLPGPANFGPEWKAEFDAIYPDLAAKYDTLLVPDFMAGLGSHDPAALRGLMQGDGIHPNAEGVGKIVATLGPEVLALIARAKP